MRMLLGAWTSLAGTPVVSPCCSGSVRLGALLSKNLHRL
jgi:hypothetical protein